MARVKSRWSRVVAKGLVIGGAPRLTPGGGRTWWAHDEFTPINIKPTILRKKIEDLREAGRLSSRDATCAPLTTPVRPG